MELDTKQNNLRIDFNCNKVKFTFSLSNISFFPAYRMRAALQLANLGHLYTDYIVRFNSVHIDAHKGLFAFLYLPVAHQEGLLILLAVYLLFCLLLSVSTDRYYNAELSTIVSFVIFCISLPLCVMECLSLRIGN